LHRAMIAENNSLVGTTHVGSSPWFTWPIMKHPMSYWVSDPTHPSSGIVLLLGNPLVWWGSLAASLAGWLLFFLRRSRWKAHRDALAILTGAYLLNFLPFAAIQRLMFLYHYLFALVVLCLLGALSLGVLMRWDGDDELSFAFATRRSKIAYWALLGVLAGGFVYFAAFSYALPISQSSFEARFWLLHPHF